MVYGSTTIYGSTTPTRSPKRTSAVISRCGVAGETLILNSIFYQTFKIDTVVATDYPLQYEWLDADFCASLTEEKLFNGPLCPPSTLTATIAGEEVRFALTPPPGGSTVVNQAFLGATNAFPNLPSGNEIRPIDLAELLIGHTVCAGVPITIQVTFLQSARFYLFMSGRTRC